MALCYSPFYYHLEFKAQIFVWILNLSCSGRIFVILRVSEKNKYVFIIYEHIFVLVFSSFLITVRLGSTAVFILIIFTLKTSHTLYLFCYPYCQHLSRIIFWYYSKYEHSLMSNILAKVLQLTMVRKLECRILLDILKWWSL